MDETIGILLQAKDQASAVLSKVKGEILGLGTAGSTARQHLSTLNSVVTGLHGAFGHLQTRLQQIASIAGFGGVAGAVAGVTAFLKDSISSAEEFGLTAGKIASILGTTHTSAQLLTGVLEHFNITGDDATRVVGLLEKNLGRLTETSDGAAKIQQQFGFNVFDASGHVKDATTLLGDLSDYWNNTGIPTQQRVLLMQELFGKSWQDMLPILQAGKAGIADVAQEVQNYGLTSQDFVVKAQQQQQAMRGFNEALGALKITIGAEFLPILTDLANQLTTFLNNPENQRNIRDFFDTLKGHIQDAIHFVKDELLPQIVSLAKSVQTFWAMVPKPIKDLLETGIVADRTIKFMLGFSLTDVGSSLLKLLAPTIQSIGASIFKDTPLAGLFQRGTPANPMYVRDVLAETELGTADTELGAGGAQAGLLGAIKGGLGSLLVAVTAIGAAYETIRTFVDPVFNAIANWFGAKGSVSDNFGLSPSNETGPLPNINPFDAGGSMRAWRMAHGLDPNTGQPIAPGANAMPYMPYGPPTPDYALGQGRSTYQMPTNMGATTAAIANPLDPNGVMAGWGDVGKQLDQTAADVTKAASEMVAALGNVRGGSKSAFDAWKQATGKEGYDSIPHRIKALQNEMAQLDKADPMKMGPDALAKWITAKQGVQDELSQLQYFMQNHAQIIGQALPNALANAQGDWQTQWDQLFGIAQTGAANINGLGITFGEAKPGRGGVTLIYPKTPPPTSGSGATSTGSGGSGGAGSGPAPALNLSGVTGLLGDIKAAIMDVGQRADTDNLRDFLVNIHEAIDALGSGILNTINTSIVSQGPVLATDIIAVRTSVDSQGSAIIAKLSALMAKVQPIFITIKPQPVNVYMNSKLIAQQLSSESQSRYPTYTSPSGPTRE